MLNQALYNKADNYYTFTENWLNFMGTITGNAAIAENENSVAQFYAIPAYTNAPVLMVYNNDKTLMANSDNLVFDAAKQIQVTRLPGSATPQYLLFSEGTDGKLYYHKVDMTLNDSVSGDITSKNQVLDNVNADYNGQLLAIEDQTSGTVKLLATRLSGGTLHLVKFEISSALSGAIAPVELLTINNSYGAADMKLSPDGKKLLLYQFTGTGILGVKPAEMLVYNLADNYQMADADGKPYTGTPATVPVAADIALPDGTLANSSAEFTPTGNAVVFNQVNTTGSSINNFIPGDGTVTTLLANTTGDISLRSDGRIYISPYGSNALLSYEPDMASYTSLSSAATLTGTMANKVYKAQSAVITEQTYARLTGLKQYELKDHLGNVRSVVSDLLTATGTGGTPVNDARVLAYYNYYPFGMQMPGRYGPPNMVGNGGYRYGFNGKEKDDDFGGSTSAVYDYGFRIYDSRIAKFLSVDPLTHKYPWYTPYQFAGNNPILFVDLDGLEPAIPVEQYGKYTTKITSFSDGQVARLVSCPIKKKSYWIVEQNGTSNPDMTSYLYYDNKKGWGEFDPVTQAGIDHQNVVAVDAFCDVFEKSFIAAIAVPLAGEISGSVIARKVFKDFSYDIVRQFVANYTLNGNDFNKAIDDIDYANALISGISRNIKVKSQSIDIVKKVMAETGKTVFDFTTKEGGNVKLPGNGNDVSFYTEFLTRQVTGQMSAKKPLDQWAQDIIIKKMLRSKVQQEIQRAIKSNSSNVKNEGNVNNK